MRIDQSTIWAAFATWWRREFQDDPGARSAHPHLLIYTQANTYYQHNPRLYERAAAGGFRNTDDEFPNPEQITHVIAEYLSRSPGLGERYWPSWAAFAQDVGLTQHRGEKS